MATRAGFLGTIGIAAAIVTALVRPGLPTAAPSSDHGSVGNSPRTAEPAQSDGKLARAAPANAFESGTSLLCAYFGDSIPAGTIRLPISGDSSSARCREEIAKTSIQPLIVTLPDPISSHLDWSYDAGLESVFRAFERSGFVVDRFWLPWHARTDTATGAILARSLPGTTHPGVLLFRKISTSQLQLVYVIGEVPTFGIHRIALRSAFDEIRQLRLLDTIKHSRRPLRIVGPVFSGSARSLREALKDARDLDSGSVLSTPAPAAIGGHLWQQWVPVRPTPKARIISGAASDFGNLAILNDSNLQLEFSATVHTSQALRAAESYALHTLGIDSLEVAFLHEGSTVYGMGAADTVKGSSALQLTFPMNISSLRTQYARHPLPNAATSIGNAPGAPAAPRLPLDLREPASLTERPAVISELTAPAAELELAEIERTLLLHQVRAVGILATDVRDALFLADELRQTLPDVQLFFFGSNVLFLREEYRKALRGSLILSTYPLFLENQAWFRSSADNTAAMFMSDEAEGIYNATLLQLGGPGAMTDYGRLKETSDTMQRNRPPIWVTTIGRSSFFPVALVTADSITDTPDEAAYVRDRGLPEKASRAPHSPHRGGFLLLLALVPAGLVGSLWVLQQKSVRRVHPARALRRDEELLAGAAIGTDWLSRQRVAISLLLHRELYVLLRYFALFGAFASLLLVTLRPFARGQAVSSAGLIAIGVFGLILSIVVAWRAIVQSGRVVAVGWSQSIKVFGVDGPRRALILWSIEVAARSLVLIAGVLYFLATIGFVWQVLHLPAGRSPIFFQRVVAITSGVSPALPLILAAVGFAAWATWHLLRISLLAEPTTYETFLLLEAETERNKDRVGYLRRRGSEYDLWAELLGQAERQRAGGAPVESNTKRRASRTIDAWAVERAETQPTIGDHESALSLQERRKAAEEVGRRFRNKADGLRAGQGTQLAAVIARRESARAMPSPAVETADDVRNATTAELKARVRSGAPRTPLRKTATRWYSSAVDWLERNLRRTPLPSAAAAAQEVRDTLFYLIPTFPALFSLLIVGGATYWLNGQFEFSMETLALPPSLPAVFGASWFDLLFRFGILGAVGVTGWGVYRLLQIWSGLRRQMAQIDRALLPAFERLPEALGRVTRLLPYGHPSRADIQKLAGEKWAAVRSIFLREAKALKGTAADLPNDAYASKLWPPEPRVHAFRISGWADHQFAALINSVQTLRAEAEFAAWPPTDPRRLWVEAASDLLAVYIADYLDWVFQHLRYLAAFLLVSLIVTMTLLGSYPFQPQTAVKVLYLIVMGVGVGSLLTITVQMTRDDVLQAITKTPDATDGKSHDPHLIGNLLTYGLIPLLTLLSAEVPGVRTLLFSWVMPLLRAFAKN